MNRGDDAEARSFARYLVGTDPRPEEVIRYREAVAARLAVPPDGVVRLALRSPVLIGPLDAAAAILDPGHQLRRRLVLMTAVLEASPAHVERFLPRQWSVTEVIVTLLRVAVAAPLRIAVGAPIFVAARLVRR